MNCLFKKSFSILMKNPYILLLLVLYLVITASVFQILFYGSVQIGYILLFLFTAAFFAGWFGMVKFLVAYKETGNLEEDLKNQFYSFKHEFFSSVSTKILPISVYFLLSAGICCALVYCADKFIGQGNEVLKQISAITNNKDILYNFITTLPDETKIMLFKRSMFLYLSLILFSFCTLYAIPALYFNKSANPFLGILNGIKAIFKKPLFSVGLYVLILFANIVLTFFEAIAAYINQPMMFIMFTIRIYFAAYVVVLIFSVYEKHFAFNCNNGPDCIGEDSSCN